MRQRDLPAKLEVKGDTTSIELMTLTSGRVRMRVPYWCGQRKKSVTFYFDPACISWQIVDPVAGLLKGMLADAQANVDRMKAGLP